MDGTAIVPVFVSPLLAVVVIAMASGFAWSAARPVLRDPTGPALAERLHGWRVHQQWAISIGIGVLAFSGRHALWTIPTLWLALQVITHRVRVRACGDTWTLVGQLGWTLRAYVATIAFWWATALAPLALLGLGAPPLAVVATGLALLAWNHFYGDVLLALIRATPLRQPELDAAFEPVLERARVPRPRLMRAGPAGARIANAFALSQPRGDVVLFFDALLDHATPAQAAGVLAHEVGHLEDFAVRRGRLYAFGAGLAVGAPALTLTVKGFAPGFASTAAYAWCGVVLIALILRVRDSQQRERDSDRRAVELCGGNGEALIDALLRLHTLMHTPRRLDPAFERQATHPSLARRIRAIRAASGAPPDLLEPCAISGAEPTRAIVFERERLVFVTGSQAVDVSSPEAAVAGAAALDGVPYGDLVDLRTEPSREGGVILVAVDRAGRSRRLRIAAPQVPALDAALDRADQRLSTDAPPPPRSAALERFVAGIAVIVVLASAAWTLVFAAVAAVFAPTAPALTAVAAATMVTALRPTPTSPIARIALALVAVLCAGLAVRRARVQRLAGQPLSWRGVLPASLASAFAALWPTWWIAALGHADAVALHVAARAWIAGAAGWAALGALFLVLPRRLGKIAGTACLVIATALGGAASDAFRDRHAPDPLIAAGAPPLVLDDLPEHPVARLTLAGTHWGIALAPDARHVLVRGQIRGGPLPIVPFTVAAFDGWHRTIEAHDAAIVDGATLLVARDEGTARVLTAESIRDGVVRWTLRVPDAPMGPLDVDTTGRWRLSTDAEAEPADRVPPQLVIGGRIGDAALLRGEAPLTVRRDFVGHHHPLSWLLPELSWRTEITRPTAGGPRQLARTRLTVECSGAFLASPTAPCLASTGDETFVWTVDVERGTLQPTARADGRFVGTGTTGAAGLVWHDRQLLLLRAGSATALRVSTGDGCPCPHGAAARGGHVATLTSAPDQTIVALYQVAR